MSANMRTVSVGDVTVLYSYGTLVAGHVAGIGFFRTSKKWSVTTSKHINKWIAGHGGSGRARELDQATMDAFLVGNKTIIEELGNAPHDGNCVQRVHRAAECGCSKSETLESLED